MPYVAQRVHTMWGVKYGPPGNALDLPHIVPAESVERLPFRTLKNLLDRHMIKQVEAVDYRSPAAAVVASDFDSDPRVVNEGKGWFLVDGERCHGRKAAEQALSELGG